MKPRSLLFIAALCSVFTALAQDTIYYNAGWKTTTRDKASYFRTKEKKDSLWQVTDHFIKGPVQMTGAYADDSFHINQGEFSWFDEKGVVSHRCTYVNGKLEGPESYYYPNGKMKVAGQNKADKQAGEWTGYYLNGKSSGKARYDTGRQVSATFYNEDGSRNKEISVFLKDSQYPGGMPKYLRFLNKTLRYPDSAVAHNIEGIVIVNFKVSKEGMVSAFKIDQAVDKYLDAEALRVLKLMPDWEPAIMGGIPSDSYHRQPVVFRLQ
jgi:protein TonB